MKQDEMLLGYITEFVGIYDEDLNLTWENFEPEYSQKYAIEELKKCSEGTKGLYLWGPVGTGKSRLAKAWLMEQLRGYAASPPDRPPRPFHRHIKTSRFLSWRKLRQDLRDRMSAKSSEPSPLHEAYTAPFLVIDDLGAGSTTDYFNEIAEELLEQRAAKHLVTIVTGNYSLEDMEDRMGERVTSRLALLCKEFELVGLDFRRK